MTRRLTSSQALLDRAAKAAVKAGCVAEVVDGIIRFLPVTSSAHLPSADSAAEDAWDKALGLR